MRNKIFAAIVIMVVLAIGYVIIIKMEETNRDPFNTLVSDDTGKTERESSNKTTSLSDNSVFVFGKAYIESLDLIKAGEIKIFGQKMNENISQEQMYTQMITNIKTAKIDIEKAITIIRPFTHSEVGTIANLSDTIIQSYNWQVDTINNELEKQARAQTVVYEEVKNENTKQDIILLLQEQFDGMLGMIMQNAMDVSLILSSPVVSVHGESITLSKQGKEALISMINNIRVQDKRSNISQTQVGASLEFILRILQEQ